MTRPPIVTDEVVERDWTGEAARLSLDAADRPPVRRSTLGGGFQHAAWMLTEIEEGRIIGNKAHRWLGYAQGLLVENGYLTLEEAKDANKIASEGSAAIAAMPTIDQDGGELRGKRPRIPTPEMIAAAWAVIERDKKATGVAKLGPGLGVREIWQAMYDAASEPPAQPENDQCQD